MKNNIFKIHLILSTLLIIGVGCTNAATPLEKKSKSTEDQTVRVCALFDTQPNDSGPCWTITESDTKKLVGMITTLPESDWSNYPEPKLGYNGLQVTLPASNDLSPGNPMTIISIFNGNIYYNSDMLAYTSSVAYIDEPNPHMVYRKDSDKQIEMWLLGLDEGAIDYEQRLEMNEAWSGTNRFVRDTYSVPMELWVRGFDYDDTVNMSAAPTLQQFRLMPGISASLPYSPKWKIETRVVLPYNEISTQQTGLDHALFTFGKYVSGGTYVTREYTLDIQLDEKAPSKMEKTQNECNDLTDQTTGKLLTPPPQQVNVGDIRGVTYLSGGAKGCATVYEFTLPGKFTGTLQQWSGMGADNFSHEFTPDMRRIIESLRIVTDEPSTLSFANGKIVGIEKVKLFEDTDGYSEQVYIADTKTGNKVYLDKPEVLMFRPVYNLKKIDEQTFSFEISANPHFGHRAIHNTDGTQLEFYPIGDECHFQSSFPIELQEVARTKCLTNPGSGTFEELLEKNKE